jgi:hypothetical protein
MILFKYFNTLGTGYLNCLYAYKCKSASPVLNVLIVFNISNIDKEINKKLPGDDLIEDRYMLECFLKCFK